MYQNITIVGRLTADPIMKYLESGSAVTAFSVATERKWKNASGEQVKEVTYFRVSAWGGTAENVNQYMHKGNMVLVEGSIRPDPQTGGPRLYTRKDGTPGASFEINAQTVRFLDSKSSESHDDEPDVTAADTAAGF